MSSLLWTLLGCSLLAAADAEKPPTLRYLRPEEKRFVLESEITTTTTSKSTTYVSRTERGEEKTTLTIRSDTKGKARVALVVVEKGRQRNTAQLDLTGPRAKLKRGGTTDFFKAPANPIVTTAPDWSDIFALVRRYDASRGGKQEFPGLWIHPRKPLLTLTFTIERAGTDRVTVKDRPVELTRYRVHLRSGDYLVWARPDGVVCKLIAQSAGAVPVVLEGYQEATRNLPR